MYSNKDNVNILTSLLVAHGVTHAVVCPGSRNAPIVHNLNECPDIACYPVTDERSAGFYALGMAQALNRPVAVCVTSGSALLNVIPAVAEAKYQRQPLVIISADRPQQWIDQLDGQTLPQPGTLGALVSKCVSLPEPSNEEERWYCNRLVNEALLALPGCVHINVPITEPLFGFDTPALPCERKIERIIPSTDYSCLRPDFVEGLAKAQRPMIVLGQSSPHDFSGDGLEYLFSHVIVLHEALAPFPNVSHFDEVLARTEASRLPAPPDFVLYVGGCIVSKRLKHYLRQAHDAQVWRVSPTGDIEDTFQNLRGVIVGDAEFVLQALSDKLSKRHHPNGMDYRRHWLRLLTEASTHADSYEPAFSQLAAVRTFEQQLGRVSRKDDRLFHVHYANSSAIRLANIYAHHHVWCNRGVNGIEGSLSTAAGFSLASRHCQLSGKPRQAPSVPGAPLTLVVIGDLSFFYDQNALWNQNLSGNLRILLLNNGKGGIFHMLPGLEKSPACNRLVAGQHATSAEGTCMQNNVVYLKASDMQHLQDKIRTLLTAESERPMLLEVFTNAEDDRQELEKYYKEA